MEQKQGLQNFAVNIKDIMQKVEDTITEGMGKPAKLTLHEQRSILQFYLEVVDYISK